jgi:hypothetical protein
MLTLGALHAVSLVFFDWSIAAYWKGPTVMPFMAADITLLMGIIYLIYRTLYGVPAHLFLEQERRYAEDCE